MKKNGKKKRKKRYISQLKQRYIPFFYYNFNFLAGNYCFNKKYYTFVPANAIAADVV